MFGFVDAPASLCEEIDELREENANYEVRLRNAKLISELLAKENEELKKELAALKPAEERTSYFTLEELKLAFAKQAEEEGWELVNIRVDIDWKYVLDEWGMNKSIVTTLRGIETVERKV